MNRTRATLLLLVASLASLSATGCHRHRVARGAHPTVAYQPRMVMMAPQPIVIVVETRAAGAPDADYAQEAAAREEAAREEAGREQAAREHAMRQARIAQERARREQARAERVRAAQERAELARAEREQAARDAQARAAAAQGQTTIIVVGPGGAQPVRVNGWFEGQ
jgi:hypothetical protein